MEKYDLIKLMLKSRSLSVNDKKRLVLLATQEIEKKEKRQREGIQAKKERGEWDDYGRPATMKLEDFAHEYLKVESGELRPFELMRKLGMSKTTFYRYVSRLH